MIEMKEKRFKEGEMVFVQLLLNLSVKRNGKYTRIALGRLSAITDLHIIYRSQI